MKQSLTVMVFIIVTILLCSNAYATHRSWNQSTVTQGTGYYIGVSGGLGNLDDSALDNANPIDIEYDPGFLVGGVLGYDFGMWRLDAEIAYRTNDASNLIFPAPLGQLPVGDGSTTALSYMVNGYFDIPTNMLIKPYLGGGIGYATVSLDVSVPPGTFPPGFSSTVADDSDSVLAYQFSAGIGFEISRTTALSLGYRYFATDDLEMMTIGAVPFTTEYQSHEFSIGVRFLFN